MRTSSFCFDVSSKEYWKLSIINRPKSVVLIESRIWLELTRTIRSTPFNRLISNWRGECRIGNDIHPSSIEWLEWSSPFGRLLGYSVTYITAKANTHWNRHHGGLKVYPKHLNKSGTRGKNNNMFLPPSREMQWLLLQCHHLRNEHRKDSVSPFHFVVSENAGMLRTRLQAPKQFQVHIVFVWI